GLASSIDSFGIVINEILFNPHPTAVDYVEIYNRSPKVYDLKNLFIANRSSSTNAIGSIRQIVTENVLLFPADYFVISENGAIVKQNYTAQNPGNFIDVTMPSFPDDKGAVVLLNAQGQIADELRYDQKWHSPLIDNKEGISLERIDYNKPTQDKNNWHSAASTVGFVTPSYQNSQFRADVVLQGEVTVSPKVFSPDNDGFDDFAILNLQLSEPNYVATITIFDAAGRPVKNLAKNATLGTTGSFRWDGLDDKLRKVPVGAYVVYTEVFNLNGKKRAFKNTVVIAARF
nr:lamin tail domain-containing protein [Segetibacter sp.]